MDIELKNLSKNFGDNKVLNNINIIFKYNKVNFIMGNSGCGKTTLVNILIGLCNYNSGSILGVENKKFSVVFQEDRLCENINSLKNIRLVCDKNISDKKIKDNLISVGLEDSIYKPVFELSGGMKRRVSIVRAVIYKSDILIMDEPFKGIDEINKNIVIQYIKSNIYRRTVIIITHNKNDIKKFESENIIFLK